MFTCVCDILLSLSIIKLLQSYASFEKKERAQSVTFTYIALRRELMTEQQIMKGGVNISLYYFHRS